MEVRHGRLLGVVGSPRRVPGLALCPALVEVDPPHACYPLSDVFRPRMEVLGGFEYGGPPDALWVRARLPAVFGYCPLQVADGRPYLLDAGFVAVLDPDVIPVAVPFACADDAELGCHLVVCGAVEAAAQDRIAAGFWGL